MTPGDPTFVTVINFNDRTSATIDIYQQFHPTATEAEILINSIPNTPSYLLRSPLGEVFQASPNETLNLDNIVLEPYQSLLLLLDHSPTPQSSSNLLRLDSTTMVSLISLYILSSMFNSYSIIIHFIFKT